MTFPALPPEVNVGRLMSGAGPAPATAAAAAWSVVASAASARSAFLTSLLPRLAASWQAPETALMTRNVAMYLAYNEALRVQALLAATRHTKQAADYSAALAGMAQLPEIVQNQVTHGVLQATNFLGVNTGAIAANEAQYAGMWAQNAAMMFGYLANSMANMTFEPFIPPKPIASPVTAPIAPAAAGAASVGDAVVTKLALAAQGAAAVASSLAMRASGTVVIGTKMVQSLAASGMRAEAAANEANRAETSGNQPAPTGTQLGAQLVQQLGTAGFAGIGAAASGLVGLSQQVGSQAVSVGSSVAVSQPLSQLVSSIDTENRTASVGYFGTRPGSPALETIARGAGVSGAASAVRGQTNSPVVAPATWQTGGLTVAPPPPPPPRIFAEPLRVAQPVSSTAPVARSKGRQRERVVVPPTAAVPIPVYQDAPPEYETVPVDVPSTGEGG
ncbi:PPE family protein [Tsukamurella strandjordii]|uniref:PPE family protein n=2 Tax=Tsukamurella strandjordii TaxID=147577 RepID=A0AA90N927_9ACTN|nr:PPE family protein [Tsukamurella strandjordii]MDP0397135.1 PPE family protein [Tsukamurella strandjordii]